jgi:2-polyprenyl-6-methoxyphenol hydroxylase-like FAD-dependent oxidoreductase
MIFHRGQGGNTAIRDAYEFVKAMVSMRDGKQTLQAAVDAYDQDVVARGEEVEMGRKQTQAFHNFESFMQSPRLKVGIKPQGKQLGSSSSSSIVIMVYM